MFQNCTIYNSITYYIIFIKDLMEDDKRRLHVGKCRIQHFLHMATSSGYFQLSKLPIIF